MTTRVTIDTNCINAKGMQSDLNQLEDLDRRGLIKLTKTFVMGIELASDSTRYGQARRQKAASRPTAVSGFMIGRSTVGGPDVIGGPDAYAYVDSILEIIRPGVIWEDVSLNTQRDILHLSAHRTYGWDIFVTSDGEILTHATALLESVSIRVMTPRVALLELSRQGIS